jgi:ribose transport system ATP-binding protein
VSAAVLTGQGLTKSFWGQLALDDVNLELAPGSVLGLVGENGAGKSTLLNLLSGCLAPDSGELVVRGRPARPRSYLDATALGIFRVFQEPALVASMSVAENLFLAHEDLFISRGMLSTRRMRASAREVLDRFDHGWIDVDRPAGEYEFATRQVLEIIKAFALSEVLGVDEPVILLDEPTAGLAREEIDFLFALLQRVRGSAALVFVSHRLSEVLELSDRLLVLKDGRTVAAMPSAGVEEKQLHMHMVGRVRDEQFYREGRQLDAGAAEARLRAERLTLPGWFEGVDLEVKAGEIVGVAGVLGSGKSQLAQALFGMHRDATGTVEIDGRPTERLDIGRMMRLGVGYVTPDRQDEGVIGCLPVSWNITLAELSTSGRGVVGRRRERARAHELVERLRVKTGGLDEPVESLSGGNQQKVVIARWLCFGVRILVLDNPTRGIDAGAKEEIYALLRELAEQGTAILIVSDDLLEVIGLSNRILVMKDGHVVREVPSPVEAKPHETDLVAAMV